jgi:hypothetical protein
MRLSKLQGIPCQSRWLPFQISVLEDSACVGVCEEQVPDSFQGALPCTLLLSPKPYCPDLKELKLGKGAEPERVTLLPLISLFHQN